MATCKQWCLPWFLPCILFAVLMFLRSSSRSLSGVRRVKRHASPKPGIATATPPVCPATLLANASAWFDQHKTPWELNCGDQLAMSAIFAASPTRKLKTFCNVGANKGYFALGWVARWAPEYRLAPAQLESYWANFSVHAPEGGCGEAFEMIADTSLMFQGSEDSERARFWAVEAAPRTFDALSRSPIAPPHGPVTLIHAAANDVGGSLLFEVRSRYRSLRLKSS
jgi:hypothetical protein